MHVTLDSEFAATPAYIDPPVDHAGRDVDGNTLDLLQDLGTFHDWPTVGAAIFTVTLRRWVKRDFGIGHVFFLTIESLYQFSSLLSSSLLVHHSTCLLVFLAYFILYRETIDALCRGTSSESKRQYDKFH